MLFVLAPAVLVLPHVAERLAGARPVDLRAAAGEHDPALIKNEMLKTLVKLKTQQSVWGEALVLLKVLAAAVPRWQQVPTPQFLSCPCEPGFECTSTYECVLPRRCETNEDCPKYYKCVPGTPARSPCVPAPPANPKHPAIHSTLKALVKAQKQLPGLRAQSEAAEPAVLSVIVALHESSILGGDSASGGGASVRASGATDFPPWRYTEEVNKLIQKLREIRTVYMDFLFWLGRAMLFFKDERNKAAAKGAQSALRSIDRLMRGTERVIADLKRSLP